MGIENLTGGAFDDTLTGGTGTNVLTGGAGNDTLTGGNGNDTFVFEAGFGQDTVTDFTSGVDVIEVRDGLFANANAALAAATQTGSDVTIALNASDRIILQNVALTNLSASDFAVVPSGMASGSMQAASHDTALTQLVQAMASYSETSTGFDSAAYTQFSSDHGLQNVVAASSH
jgi:Ca2+-binding RTX toxin-like protein